MTRYFQAVVNSGACALNGIAGLFVSMTPEHSVLCRVCERPHLSAARGRRLPCHSGQYVSPGE